MNRTLFRLTAVASGAACLVFALACKGPSKPSQEEAVRVTAPAIRWVRGPAGRLRVDDGGSGGLPVLFVHGLAGDGSVWAAQLRHLRTTRRAVAVDLRGHGESDPPADGDYSVPAMASDVAAVADALGLQRFVLVGHSWGGPIVAAYAAGHPERVAGILFCDPAGDLSKIPPKDRQAFLDQLSKGDFMANVRGFWDQMLKPAKPATRDTVLAGFGRHSPALFRSAWQGMFAHDTAADLSRIPCPMLSVVTPENDEAYSLHKLDPAIEAVPVRGTSHWVMLDDPEGFNRILDGFLARLNQAPPDSAGAGAG